MKLLAYMKSHNLSDAEMASLIGECSAGQVKKWKYGERSPRLREVLRIETATGGSVKAHDFLATLDKVA